MFKRLLPVVLVVGAMPAWGLTTYYNGNATEASFTSALGLSGLTIGGAINFGAATVTGGGTSVLDVGGTGTDFFALSNSLEISGTQLRDATAGGTFWGVTVDPSSTTYAIGLHLATVGSGATTCVVDCSNMMSLNSTPQFFGIISTSPIPAFPIQLNGGRFVITDFKIGTLSVSETPEPSTMALMGAALISLTLTARRRRRP